MYEQLAHYIESIVDVNQAELDLILARFQPSQAKKNEMLLTGDQASQRSYFITKGCVRIFFINQEGQESTRYFAFENNAATALISFITGAPSAEFIQAVEATELLYITHHDFYQLLDVVPKWEKFYRIYLERAYVANTKRLMSLFTQDATEKYRMLLKESPIIVRRLPNKLVASYLGISQETLSRLKSKIKY